MLIRPRPKPVCTSQNSVESLPFVDSLNFLSPSAMMAHGWNEGGGECEARAGGRLLLAPGPGPRPLCPHTAALPDNHFAAHSRCRCSEFLRLL